jgi:hypothetical protein
MLFLYLPFVEEINGALQVTRMPNIGLRLPTHQRIITSIGKRTTLEPPRGSSKVMH